MIGAVIGDILGSRYEGTMFQRDPIELKNPICNFTDDTVLTVAVAEALLRNEPPEQSYKRWWAKYPDRGYGGWFSQWAREDSDDVVESTSNGAAMRVSPIALLGSGQDSVAQTARKFAHPTHNTEEAKHGAEAIAVLTWFALRDPDPSFLRTVATTDYYQLETVEFYMENQKFETRCSDTVPKAITAALESTCFEDVMTNAVKIGGDVDTIACMAGGIAEALYGIPGSLGEWSWDRVPREMRMIYEELYRKSGREIAFTGREKNSQKEAGSLLGKLLGSLKGA